MASVDIQFVRNRKREIRHAIHRSSPVLLYSGPVGIVMIAASKSVVRNRIGKILDRMAVVSRGELTASDIVHKVAAGEAYALAHSLSRGDVLGHEPVQAVSAVLSRHFHAFLGEPLAVESCIVQLNETPETDYMAHIGPDGSVQLFDRTLYLGAPGKHRDAEQAPDSKESDSEHGVQERLDDLNRELRQRYAEYTDVAPLIADLELVTELAPLFTAGRRRDVVVLDREALKRREFDGIFKRLTL